MLSLDWDSVLFDVTYFNHSDKKMITIYKLMPFLIVVSEFYLVFDHFGTLATKLWY